MRLLSPVSHSFHVFVSRQIAALYCLLTWIVSGQEGNNQACDIVIMFKFYLPSLSGTLENLLRDRALITQSRARAVSELLPSYFEISSTRDPQT